MKMRLHLSVMMTDAIERLARRTNCDDEINMEILKHEIGRWHKLQVQLEDKYLTPDESELKWQ